MIDPQRLAAFLLVTATTSMVPGVSMLFVMSQAVWRGTRSGWAALLGMQVGYAVWWIFAALGLGTLAAAYPLAFQLLAVAGGLYLAWLGMQAIRHSFHVAGDAPQTARKPSRHAFRDGIAVAIGNPKSLVYMVAIIPPFIDPAQSVPRQILVLALAALAVDLVIGSLYIGAGRRLAQFMERPATRRWIDRAIGLLFIAIAFAILANMAP